MSHETILDEANYRRPDFVAGAPVRLANGEYFSLRKPVVRFVPALNEAGFEIAMTVAGDDGFNELLAARDEILDRDAPLGELIKAELAIARELLVANYDLDLKQLRSLLQFGYNAEKDPDGTRIRDEVLAVAYGRSAEKPPAVGDDAAPTPTAD